MPENRDVIMEQKRTLWIIAAVGVFLLFVLGAAMIIYKPAASATTTLASTSARSSNGWFSLEPQSSSVPVYSNGTDNGEDFQDDNVSDYNQISAPDESALATNVKIDNLTVYSENTNLYSKNTSAPSATTIDLISASSSKTSDSSVRPVSGTAKEAVKKAEVTKPVSAAAKSASKSSVVNTSAASSSKSTVAVKTTGYQTPKVSSTVIKTQFWVQVSSFKSRKSADAAREVLDKNRISADVFTITNDKNEVFYRVRVGPYTTKTEAEYWREKISKIDMFAGTDSFVAKTEVNASAF